MDVRIPARAVRLALVLSVAISAIALPSGPTLATDILSVFPAALDQPRIYSLLRLSPTGAPLSADFGFGRTFNIEAYLDTGASGVLISNETGDALGLTRTKAVNPANGQMQDVIFSDVGVAGADNFNVTQQLYISSAQFHPETDVDNSSTYNTVYNQTIGPVRAQFGPTPPGSNPELSGLDVFGMPLMMGKVAVFDPKPVDTFLDTMRSYLYNPGTPFNAAQADTNPGIPTTNHTVKLSYGSFDRFTEVTPAGAPGPTLNHNPFIGPDPVAKLNPNPPVDTTPPVKIGRLTTDNVQLNSTGSFLLDTGASASILSKAQAANLSVQYKAGTYGTDDPILVDEHNVALPNQFSLTIGGIGGSTKAAGFYLDSMTIPTIEGDPIRFVKAPVLVIDIAVADPITHQSMTLDGVFGMNNMVASVLLDDSGAGFLDLAPGNFDWIVFDEINGRLGLQLTTAFPGDANRDGKSDFTDLGVLLSHFNKRGFWADGDFNSNGFVDFTDLGILLANFNKSAPTLQALAVPEPSSFALLAVGLAACLVRRQSFLRQEPGV